MAECGTISGTIGHYAAGEKPCDACSTAQRLYQRALRERHRGDRPKWFHPDSIATQLLDVVATYQPVSLAELPTLLPDARPDTIRRTAYKHLATGRLRRSSQGSLYAD